MVEILKLGICGICDITPIFKRVDKRLIATEDYSEFSFVLSDGMVYRHAICRKCINELDNIKVAKVIERIKAHWAHEMVGWGTKNDFNRIENLEIKTYHIEEKEALKQYEELKKQEFETHLQEVKLQKDIAKGLKEEQKT